MIGSVAFVLQDGVSAIAPQLKSVSKVATFFIGIRNDITTVQAVKALLGLGVRVYLPQRILARAGMASQIQRYHQRQTRDGDFVLSY